MRRTAIFSTFFIILLLSGCAEIKNSLQRSAPALTRLLVQGYSTSPVITSMMQDLSFQANNIIKEELGANYPNNTDLFLPKERQRITLYYINDIDVENTKNIVSMLKKLHLSKMRARSLETSCTVSFFGEWEDELAILLNDSQQELRTYHHTIKTHMHQLYAYHYARYNKDLYNIKESECFPFLPHMGLGRLRVRNIRNACQDEAFAEQALQRIRSRILQSAEQLLKKAGCSVTLPFTKIGILDVKKRAYVKEWDIE